jgi:hypothetical protein
LIISELFSDVEKEEFLFRECKMENCEGNKHFLISFVNHQNLKEKLIKNGEN